MVKTHFCKAILESGAQCGQRDSELFEQGRYSLCKSCHVNASRKCHENKRKEKKEGIDHIKVKLIDPDSNIRWLIEEHSKKGLLFNDMTMQELWEFLNQEFSNLLISNEEKEERVIKRLNEQTLAIKELMTENKELKEQFNNINEKLKRLEEKIL